MPTDMTSWTCRCGADMDAHREIRKPDCTITECPPLRPLAEGDAERVGDWRGWHTWELIKARLYTYFVRFITGNKDA